MVPELEPQLTGAGPIAKRMLLFAPCAYNLAETSRMIEIAKAVRTHPHASAAFEICSTSEGGALEPLIDENDSRGNRSEC
jgi:hypothetical protein